MNNVLVIDDEKEIADLVEIYLTNENYNVTKLYGSADAMNVIAKGDFSLIILDVMMPEIDGLSLCRMIREQYNMPIVMLSAKSMDMDKVMGLSIGADDYLTKPFNPIELLARVKAQIRRYIRLNPDSARGEDNINTLDINGLTIDKASHRVALYDNELTLTPIEFNILFLLAANAGRVIRSEEIFEEVWKEKYFEASNNTVMVHIRHLREKLGDSSRNSKFIKTVWGVGYKIEN